MKTHSENDIQSMYIGMALVNGRLCHRWLDGTVLPAFVGASDDGDDGGDGDGEGDDDADGDGDGDGDDDSDGDGDDDDKDDKSEKESARIHRLSRENAKYRTQRNKARQDLTAETEAHKATKEELDALKKSGVNDDTVKAQMSQLTQERDEARNELKTIKAERAAEDREREVSSLLDELDIDCEADVAISRLKKNGVVPGDDGDFEDLEAQLKKLLKKGVFKKKTADGDEDNEAGSSSGGSAANRSGRSTKATGKRRTGKLDPAVLKKKYPALQR